MIYTFCYLSRFSSALKVLNEYLRKETRIGMNGKKISHDVDIPVIFISWKKNSMNVIYYPFHCVSQPLLYLFVVGYF